MESYLGPPNIITLNSSKSIIPFPSLSTPLIIFLHSVMEQSSPRLLRTLCSSSAEIEPFPSRSYTENASFRFSRTSLESTPLVLSSTNSSKFMNPSPSASNSLIIFWTSSSEGCWPREPMMEASSDDEILPSPLASNILKMCSSSWGWI
ncbi:hypothetical protein E1A91_D12G175400v1 [Gossypium mustelinum]|uniref:Uncharacterized protein n=3 Tax=Gossypium TaxID=3633 RepID=A0A5J5P084_GOSBA|nr:hypothetical protein ES319_D12G173100v1 [Gossypium barbadense]TYH39498.1 hypothetical protein ES332_D12G183600v1 [Gossypium tomentosum]TYI51424.1 hypothetical protein E1A91_D12G175400v1 [Gossypium mustelinum]